MDRYIYVIDDDAMVRSSVRALLGTQQKLFTECFASGDAFLESRHALEPGVVLLDMVLPGTRGMDILRTIMQEPRQFEVIMVSGQGDLDSAVAAMKLGAADFLQKPVEPAVLLTAIDSAYARLEASLAIAAEQVAMRRRMARLSARESEVLEHLASGQYSKMIAHDLQISVRTVEAHRASMMSKLQVSTLPGALRIAFVANGIGFFRGMVPAHAETT